MKSLLIAALAGGLAATAAHADVILSGPDSNAGSYSTTALQSLATPGDTFSADGFTGISLWGLLGGTESAITTSTPAGFNGKNAILRYYVETTASNGAHSIFSLGELDPGFGGTQPIPTFIAFKDASNTLLTVPELIVPGVGGRGLSDVVSLQVLSVPALPNGVGGPSTSFSLSGNVASPGSYTKADLQANPASTTETVGTDTYTGIPLWTFLNPSGIDSVNGIVVTAGSDGYEVVLSLAELDPALGGNPADFLPYDGPGFPGVGVARTIFPTDNKHGRWESNLVSIEVEEVVPEPASLALLASAFLALPLGMRRRSKLRGSGTTI